MNGEEGEKEIRKENRKENNTPGEKIVMDNVSHVTTLFPST